MVVLIDGKDIGSLWGMGLLMGSFDGLFMYPKRKAVRFTDFAEVDGIRPDLRRFETESRGVALSFMMRYSSQDDFYARYTDFYETVIGGGGYHTFDFGTGMLYRLRYDATQSFKPGRLLGGGSGYASFTVGFREDEPAIDASVRAPYGGTPLKGWFGVDGVDFGDFGVHPDERIGEVLRYPDAKDAFTDGRVYDLSVRRLKHKEVIIPLWMYADSKAEFVNNYQAFYNAFSKPGMQSLFVREIDATVYCYYMECTAFKVRWGKRPGARLGLKLCIPVATWL